MTTKSETERIEALRGALKKILEDVPVRREDVFHLSRYTLQDIAAIANNALVDDNEQQG